MELYKEGQSGVILGRQKTDFVAGDYSPVGYKELLPSGNWLEWKPEHERQNLGFETWACSVFSATDAIETLLMWHLFRGNVPKETVLFLKEKGYFNNGFINFSDRLVANYADIQIGLGTYLYKANNALRNYLIPELFLPYVENGYYDKNLITQEILDLANEFKEHITIKWFWVDEPEKYIKMSPLQAIVKYADGEGVLKPQGAKNHAIMVHSIDENVNINDSYTRELKIYDKGYVSDYVGYYIIFNKEKTMTFKKEKGKPHIYLIDEERKYKTMIVDMPTLDIFNQPVEEVDSLDYYTDRGTLVWSERIIN